MSGGGSGYDAAALGGKFGNKLSSYLDQPAPGPSGSTWESLGRLEKQSYDPTYTSGIGKTLGSFGNVAGGADLGGQNPFFQRDLDRTLSDTRGDVLASLGGAGNLNSDLHIKTLTDALGGVRDRAYEGERQYQDARQMGAAAALPGLYQASLLPAQTQLGVGQVQDAFADPNYNRFLQLLGGFSGSAGAPGMGEHVPLWQQLAGYGAQLGGTALGTFARGGF